MKENNIVLYVLRLSVTLLLIAGIVAAVLAGVNSITAPIIQQLTWEKTQKAIEAVLPGGGEEVAIGDDASGIVQAVYKGEQGYAIQVAPSGFDGEITMMVGISNDGTVLGISIISQSETAGLGAVCADKTSKGETFRNQFVGGSGTLAVSKDGGTIDAITSATITSRAVTDGVNAALAWVAANG